jgi:hypothetical protein
MIHTVKDGSWYGNSQSVPRDKLSQKSLTEIGQTVCVCPVTSGKMAEHGKTNELGTFQNTPKILHSKLNKYYFQVRKEWKAENISLKFLPRPSQRTFPLLLAKRNPSLEEKAFFFFIDLKLQYRFFTFFFLFYCGPLHAGRRQQDVWNSHQRK